MALPSWLSGLLGRAGSEAIGFGVGGVITPVIQPRVQPLINAAWADSPTIPITAQEAATAVVQGALDYADAAGRAAASGIGGEAFATLVAINGSPPGPQDLLAMLDRGIIDEARVRHGLLQSRLKPEWVDEVIALNPALLTVEQLAEMVVQDVLPIAAATPLAAKLSYGADDFALLVRLAGSPPGPETMLELWNRGDVDEAAVDRAILQSRLKPEWLDDFKKLRRKPLSAAVAASALIKERISEADAVKIAEENGLSRDDFLTWAHSLGRPIAIGQALALVNRGEMTEDEFAEVVARSDVRTQYTDQLLKLRVRMPTLPMVRAAVHNHTVTDEVARRTLRAIGYDADWTEAAIKQAHVDKTSAHKHLSLSIVEALFDAGLQDEAHSLAAIETLGYDEPEARELLRLHEARRIVAELVRASGVIRTAYVNHLTDETETRVALDRLGLEASTKARLLELWTVERSAHIRTLTPAQVGQGLKYGVFTLDEAIARWQSLGYSEADADALAGIVEKGPIHPPAVT